MSVMMQGLINSIISVGMVVGTLMTLFIYDYLNGRLVFAVALSYGGVLSILTPSFAKLGGYYTTVIFRFFTGLYTAILTPVIPALVNGWFQPSEVYRMTVVIFSGTETGKMFFSLTGTITATVGWEFLFYFPGVFSLLMGMVFYFFMTDDFLENAW